MYSTILRWFLAGSTTETYSLTIRLAVVSQRLWLMFPGLETPKASLTLQRYKFKHVLLVGAEWFCGNTQILRGYGIKVHNIGKYSQFASCLPIGPVKLFGPVISPSSFLTRCLRGNPFICRRQTDHCRGRSTFASNNDITPPLNPTLT